MSLTLGPEPTELLVHLVREATWWATLRNVDEAGDPVDYAVDDALELRFGDTVWPAVIDGPDATWNVSEADVNTLIAAGPRDVGLWLTSSGQTIPWAIGVVDVNG